MPPTSSALARFRSNPLKQLNALSNDCEQRTMQCLETQGFTKLAMHFSAPMSLLGQRPHRLTELAQRLAVSKQLCLQSLRPLSDAGYISRQTDPSDKRAKLIALSKAGKDLITAANTELSRINQGYAKKIGAAELAFLSHYTQRLCIEMAVPGFDHPNTTIDDQLPFSLLIGMINRSLHHQLMQDTMARGHPHLQMAHGQVLACLDPLGSSIGELALTNGVSSQAISRVARQLDELGYIERHIDPSDGRSQRLSLSEAGLTLIEDAVSAMETLEKRLQNRLGETQFQRFSHALLQLSNGESDIGITPPPPTLDSKEVLRYVSAQLGDGRTDKALENAIKKRLGTSGQAQLNALLRIAVGLPVG